MTIDGHPLVYRKLKDIVLYNPTGVVTRDNYSIATTERAFLDMIYLFPDYYFDNLHPLDWEKCEDLVHLYGNRQLIKRLHHYRNKHAE